MSYFVLVYISALSHCNTFMFLPLLSHRWDPNGTTTLGQSGPFNNSIEGVDSMFPGNSELEAYHWMQLNFISKTPTLQKTQRKKKEYVACNIKKNDISEDLVCYHSAQAE